MFEKTSLKRFGVLALTILFVGLVIVASCISLCNPECINRTEELTSDGICVGVIIALIRLLHIVRRPKRITETLFSWYCLARVLFGVELRYGLVGGYLLGISRAVLECIGM